MVLIFYFKINYLYKKLIYTMVDSEKDIKKIVKDELDKFISDRFSKELKKEIGDQNSISRKEIVNIIKQALTTMNRVLWLRKEQWINDIK